MSIEPLRGSSAPAGRPRRRAARAPRPRASGTRPRRLPGRPSSTCARNISERSWRTSTSRQPSAEVMPGFGGTITVGIDSSRARSAPCSAPGAAEDDERELARVVAAADRDQADGVGHVRVGDLDDRLGGLQRLEPERLADGPRARARRRAASSVIAPPISSEPRRPSTTLASVFVGLVVAAAVARRARVGAGRLRAVAQRAGLVDPGQRAAAGADRQHLDRREADRVAVLDEPLLRDPLLALVDERDVGARAAHVEADRVLDSRTASRCGGSRSRPRRCPRRRGARRSFSAVFGVITPPPECSSRTSPS